MDTLDFWDISRNFPYAREKRRALELLEDVAHRVNTAGAEGEQVHKDKNGRKIRGEGSVQFVGLERYEAELRKRAGLAPAPKVNKQDMVKHLIAKAKGDKGV